MKKFARKMLSTFITGMLVCGMAAGAPVASVYADEGEDEVEVSTGTDADTESIEIEEVIDGLYSSDPSTWPNLDVFAVSFPGVDDNSIGSANEIILDTSYTGLLYDCSFDSDDKTDFDDYYEFSVDEESIIDISTTIIESDSVSEQSAENYFHVYVKDSDDNYIETAPMSDGLIRCHIKEAGTYYICANADVTWFYAYYSFKISQRTLEDVTIDDDHFPDDNFRDYVTQFDSDKDGSLSDDEIEPVEVISVNEREIKSLSGIDYFYNLKYLYCSGNQIKILDVSDNKLLEILQCESNQLISLNVSNNKNLKNLWCGSNQLKSLNVSNNKALQTLYCGNNIWLSGLDLSNNVNLVDLDCASCKFESLNLSKNTKLVYLYCTDCNISELDLSNNTKLKEAFCSYNSNLKSLNCSNLSELYYLEVENDPNLEKLACLNTNISYLCILNDNKLADVVEGKNYDIDKGYSTFLYEGPIRTNYEGKNELCYRKCEESATYDQDKSYDACIDTSLNDFIHIEYYDGDNFWYYFKNGRVDNDFTGPASGTVDGVKAWYYVKDGKVNFEFKDFAKVGSSWMYFSNGKVDKSINADHYGSFWGTIDGKGGWYVVKAGKAYPNYNGFALVGSSWMQYKDGKIDKSYTGTLNVNINGTKKWYYINKGKAILDYTGFGKVGSSWMRFKNGSIDKTVTGIVTGTVNGEKAQWYVKSGKVQLDYSGTYKKNGKTYTIKNGKVIKVS